MAIIKMPLNDREKKELEDIWKVNLERINKEVLERIGWKTIEDFCADVFRFGMDKASEDPKSFIRKVREEKDPIFKLLKPKPRKEYEKAFEKMYG